MIDRYRDGVVPEAEPDPALADGDGGLAGLEGDVSALLDRAELTQALEAIWPGPAPKPLRRGVEALGAGQGRGAGG